MSRTWGIGTRYHQNDTYRAMIDRGALKPRIYPGREGGKEDGKPVFRSEEWHREKRRDMGPYTYAAQILQNPTADKAQGFREEWLRYWTPRNWSGMNRYITVDPASEKKKTSDYTVFVVHGLGWDRNYYVLDWYRDRLNLSQRTKMLFLLHRNYRPKGVGYEKYGKDSDIEHIESKMADDNYRFAITPLGGQMAKADRIRRMIPKYEQGQWYIPTQCLHKTTEDRMVDVTASYVREEYLDFPVAQHDDMMDAQSRILDPEMQVVWPDPSETSDRPAWMDGIGEGGRGFMAA